MTIPSYCRYLRGAAVFFVVGLLLPSSARAQSQEEEGDDVRRRVAAFRAARADASGKIADDAWSKAWGQWATLSPWQSVAAADVAWRPLGPFGMFGNQVNFGGIGQLVAGRVTSIAPHPTDPQTVYVGAASGGVWKSTTGGATWSPLTDSQCAAAIGAVAVDPVNPAYVYAGTGEINTFEFPGCGVLRSSDAGASWTAPASNPVGQYHGKIVVDPATAGRAGQTTLLAATSAGLYVSNNSGASWSLKVSGVAWSAAAITGRPGWFYAAMYSGSRSPATTVFRSTDGGSTWTALPTPLPSAGMIARIELTSTAASSNNLYAVAANYSTRALVGVYRWSEQTSTWTQLAASGLVTSTSQYPFTIGEQGEYNLVLAVDPRSEQRIWVAGVGAFLSEDGGATFRSTARNVHVDWHALAFDPTDPDHMYAGTDGGLYVSFDAGRTWRAQNNGLAIAQFYPGVSVHPSGQWVFGGLQDNQAAYFTGGNVWNNFSRMGDGGYTAVNYGNPGIVYVTHAFMNFITRRAPGVGEQSRQLGISASDRSGMNRPIVMDPVTPTTLYFGTQRLYRTTTDGAIWFPITTDLTRASGYITSIAVAPSDSRYIYVATSDGVINRSTDGGLTFAQFVFAVNRRFTRIIVHPTNPLRVIATASTFGAPTMTQTTDGGVSFFTTVGAGLGGIPIHSVLWIPGTTTLLAGTEYGVMQTTNDGGTWTQGPPGMPTSIVQDLVWVPASTSVVASTYGRGMFAFNFGASVAVLRGDIDVDGLVTANDARLLQQSIVGVDISPLRAYPRGDANCDARLDGADVLLALRSAVGLATIGTCVGTQARPSGSGTPDAGTYRQVIRAN